MEVYKKRDTGAIEIVITVWALILTEIKQFYLMPGNSDGSIAYQ